MLLRDESPKTVVDLATVLCTRRPGSTVVIVFDNVIRQRRLADVDYLLGENGFLMRLHEASAELRPVMSQTQQELRIGNGSRVVFRSVGNERDVVQFGGLCAQMLVFDHSSTIPFSVQQAIRIRCDRTQLMVRDLIDMKAEPVVTQWSRLRA